ncbi:hypothetical protein GY45DRAFT_1432564 [Cubamyces sp. BRFM 1775]|nr:hypothetical protein GY45DRAFT_1432564 [Cubamyces sp. BRFM 1775]
MSWRTILGIHLLLTTLKLLRAECASRLDLLACSVVLSSTPFLTFALGALGVAFALGSARGLLDALIPHAVGGGVSKILGSSLPVEDSTYTPSLSSATEERIPGGWDWFGERDVHAARHDRRSCGDSSRLQQEPITKKRPRASVVDAPESDSECELTLSTSQSSEALEAPTCDNATVPLPPLSSYPSPQTQPGHSPHEADALDSSNHEDALTLHAEDMSLLGQYLARTYGMFAWRVHPIICLPGDPYPGGAPMGLFQRIDGFMKPAGRRVHYAELLVEWVPSSCAEARFLVQHAAPSNACSTREGYDGAVGELRVIGMHLHAFRARKCDPNETSRAEYFLNTLGLGTQWTCSWGWDTLLGKTFDGLEYARRALDYTLVERWYEGVREYWLNSGLTLEEADEWVREVEEFRWADGWESDSEEGYDEEAEDGWTSDWAEEDGLGWTSDDNSELQFDEDLNEEDSDEERITFIFSGTGIDAASQLPPVSLQSAASSQDGILVDRRVSEAVDKTDHEPEDEVLYPRKSELARCTSEHESDDDELILYKVPHTALAVYPPTLRTTPLGDPLTELRPVFAPIPAYAADVHPAHEPVPSALPIPPSAGDDGAIKRYPSASSSSSSDDEDSDDNKDDRRLVLHNRSGHQVALAGNGLIRMMHTLILENTPGPQNGVRCVIQVTTRSLQRVKRAVVAWAHNSLPSPESLTEVCEQLEALAEVEAQAKKKRTRRAGKRVTKRRHREREEKVVKTAQLAGELLREAHIIADEVGMVLVDIAVNVAV